MDARPELIAKRASAAVMTSDADRLLQLLHEQAGAVQRREVRRAAELGHECIRAIAGLAPGALSREVLARLRERALYNQSLFRDSMTTWAATRLDRVRSLRGYNALGQVAVGGTAAGTGWGGFRRRGVI